MSIGHLHVRRLTAFQLFDPQSLVLVPIFHVGSRSMPLCYPRYFRAGIRSQQRFQGVRQLGLGMGVLWRSTLQVCSRICFVCYFISFHILIPLCDKIMYYRHTGPVFLFIFFYYYFFLRNYSPMADIFLTPLKNCFTLANS